MYFLLLLYFDGVCFGHFLLLGKKDMKKRENSKDISKLKTKEIITINTSQSKPLFINNTSFS